MNTAKSMRKLSIVIAGRHSTSICLEEEFYEALKELAAKQNKSINRLVTEIDASRTSLNLSSAIRVYLLKQLQDSLQTN